MDFIKLFTALKKGSKLESSPVQKTIAVVLNSVVGVAALIVPAVPINEFLSPETIDTVAKYGAIGFAAYNSYITAATSDSIGMGDSNER